MTQYSYYRFGNDPKHTEKATQKDSQDKEMGYSSAAKSVTDLNPIEHVFHLLKTRMNVERLTNKQQQNADAVKDCEIGNWQIMVR